MHIKSKSGQLRKKLPYINIIKKYSSKEASKVYKKTE